MTVETPHRASIRRRIQRPDIDIAPMQPLRYTIASMVNDMAHYEAMRGSLRAGGFSGDCEYLYIDNTRGPQIGAYSGLNTLLNEARGDYVILCHQDIRLLTEGRRELDRCLADLDSRAPDWALAGNAGGVAPGVLAIRITDPHGADRRVGTLPQRVASLDENFIVVRRDARIGFSKDIEGFHFYGADICLNADIAGWQAYVIDFHIAHLSAGNKDENFAMAEAAFRAKWSRALQPRWLQTTCSLMRLSGDQIGQLAGRLVEGSFRRISRRLPGSQGWTRATPSKETA
ncbi:MAG: hypothetical protein ACK4MF_05705 [Hyphomicrobiaceae bacterium]